MRRDLEWHEPDGGHAEAMQIVKAPRQSGEVADTVAVGIHECPSRQTVNNGVLIPKVVNHWWEKPDRPAPCQRVHEAFGSRLGGCGRRLEVLWPQFDDHALMRTKV